MVEQPPGAPSQDERDTKGSIDLLALSVERYCYVTGHYPANLAQLRELPKTEWGSDVCAFASGGIRDAWGRPLLYERIQEPRIISKGPDGILGNTDDLYAATAGTEGTRAIDPVRDCSDAP